MLSPKKAQVAIENIIGIVLLIAAIIIIGYFNIMVAALLTMQVYVLGVGRTKWKN